MKRNTVAIAMAVVFCSPAVDIRAKARLSQKIRREQWRITIVQAAQKMKTQNRIK